MVNISREDRYFLDCVRRSAGKAINRFNMISDGDHVLAAVSGGKDSFVMLEILSERRKKIPIDYRITAIHVNVRNIGYGIDRGYFEDFCRSLDVEFVYTETEYEDRSGGDKSACYLCSLHRRKVLFNYMKENRCTRLALGHNMDDAVETLFMNMMFNGQMSSMPGKLSMFNGEFDIIRPLILVRNDDLLKYALLKKFISQKAVCPYNDSSSRRDIRNILKNIENDFPGSVNRIFRSMSDIKSGYLPKNSLD